MSQAVLGVLSEFHTIRPRHEMSQAHLVDSQVKLHSRSLGETMDESRIRRLVTRFACSSNQISNRGVEIDDTLFENAVDRVYSRVASQEDDSSKHLIDEYHGPAGAGIFRRMQRYQVGALRMIEEAFPEAMEPPRHILHVTCTGYVAPSVAQVLVAKSRTRIIWAATPLSRPFEWPSDYPYCERARLMFFTVKCVPSI